MGYLWWFTYHLFWYVIIGFGLVNHTEISVSIISVFTRFGWPLNNIPYHNMHYYIVWKIHFQRMNQLMKSRPKNLIKSNKSISRFFFKNLLSKITLKNSMRVTRTIIRIIFNMVKIHFSFPVINFLFHPLWMYY